MADIKLSSKFVQYKIDVNIGEKIKIKSEGKSQPNSFNPGSFNWEFEVELPSGDIKIIKLNNPTLKNLIENYGKNMADWVGKEIQLVSLEPFGKGFKAVWNAI